MCSSTLSLTSGQLGGFGKATPGRCTPRKDPVLLVQEAWWAPGPLWTGGKNPVLTGVEL